MTYYIQIGTTNYDDDRLLLRKAIGKLESKCQVTDGFLLGEPMSKFGWTFFDMILKPNLHLSIEDEFADMIKKSKGSKICPAGKAWAKRTFDTYPSAYANMAASKYCKDPNYAKGAKGKK